MERMLSSRDQHSLVSSFLDIAVGQTAKTARQVLQATSWNLNEAVQLFYAGGEGGSMLASGTHTHPMGRRSRRAAARARRERKRNDADGVRAPLPVVTETLYRDSMYYEGNYERELASLIDFLDFSEEPKRSGVWEPDEVASSASTSGPRHSLASLYRPPFHLMTHGSFEQVKITSTAEDKWLLVNLQSTTEFSSHMLNRDTWANEAVSQTIKANFIFWQAYDDITEGRKVCTYYKLESIPVILVIDPTTGQMMRMWSGMVEPETLLESLVPFLDGGPGTHFASLSKKHPRGSFSLAPHSKPKEEELQRALAATLENNGMKESSSDDTSPITTPEEAAVEATVLPTYPPLPEEPKGGDRSVQCRVGIRLPNGQRLQRNFLKTDSIQLLWSFCYSQLEESEGEKPLKLTQAIPDLAKGDSEEMSSSYNNSISSSSTQSFLLASAATGANNSNREETAMTMIQQPNSVAPLPPPKKRRNQPGNPNPDAEVIALSPKTIMATNRFLCEVCNKGFQREQNLQLHRRGHNLPWKLKQKSKQEVIRRKVYLCPEPTCVHHDPSRALGDLTGIKKHYYRKHGEKKFKCEKCSKRYAVQSDWKAHSKTCGTKEYRCDCGTIFSRRDSYITHRAFCDALLQESTRNPTVSFTAMAAAAGGGGSRPGFYGSAASALSHNHFGNNSNTSFAPLAAGYNLNRSSTEKFEAFLPQSSNPNPGPTNFLMQCPSNQGFLSQNDQTLMNQHGLISLGDNINNNNNNNSLFNLGYFQDNTKNTDHTSVPSLFTNADNNDPSALLRGLTSSSSSSAVVNDFGDSDNGNFQGLMNSLAATTDHQGRSGSSLFDLHFGNNLSMGGSDRLTLDFLGVSGGNVSNVNGSGGRSGAPLDVDMKFPRPNNPFEKS
ncbi:unnamed protein product [Brassica rapa subsp. narinosa]